MEFKSTSSGLNGWSMLSLYLSCSALAADIRSRYVPGMPRPLYEEQGNKPVATLVGSLYGDLVQHYLTDRTVIPNEEFVWVFENNDRQSLDVSHPASCAEARRLYIEYTKFYRPDHLGKIIAVEHPIIIPGSMFGVPFDISGNIDFVVETAKGIEIWDAKTEGREEANLKAKFSLRQQLWIYSLGYELETGIKPVGTGIDCVIKRKEPGFIKFEYEAVTDKRFKWLQDSILEVNNKMNNPRSEPKLTNCWPYGTPCQYLLEGMCGI